MSRAMFDQSIDRLARERPAIDIITQEHVNESLLWPERDIGVDPSQQFFEQVKATMNVADGINPYTCRQRRAPPAHSEFFKPRNGRQHSSARHCQMTSTATETQLSPHSLIRWFHNISERARRIRLFRQPIVIFITGVKTVPSTRRPATILEQNGGHGNHYEHGGTIIGWEL